MVFGVCRRQLSNEHDAEDALQATFLVLARKAGSIQKAGSVASWLFGVAGRIARQARGRAERRRRRERPATDLADREPSLGLGDFLDCFPEVNTMGSEPADTLSAAEVRAAIDEELGQLPEKFREPLLLRYLAGKTALEAARQLGCPEGTFKSRLARGRDLLRSRLARRGIALSGVALGVLTGRGAASAVVPEYLLAATARAALAFASGLPPAGTTGALALTKHFLRNTIVTKISLGLVLSLAAGLLAGTIDFANPSVSGQESPPAEKAAPKPSAEAAPGRADPLPAGP
jgi:RNA polymerase sigma-70 factor (ECF subfamily)